MNEMSFKRSRQTGYLSLLTLMGLSLLSTEEATAKLSVVRKAEVSQSMLKRLPMLGGDSSDASSSSSDSGSGSSGAACDLFCEGYPVLITEIDGKTQVFVKDDYDNDDIQSEKYRIEGDIDWSKSAIYAAGDMGEAYKDINVRMNSGHVGSIVLAGWYEDQVLGDAFLMVEGGTVENISIMGRWDSGVRGKVEINLSQMTYNGPRAISRDKWFDYCDDFGFPIYSSEDVTITYKGCEFAHPEADPDYIDPDDPFNTADYVCPSQATAGATPFHNYYIAQIQPSERFVDAGYVTVVCKDCGKRWVVPFGAIGGRGSEQDPDSYSYFVELANTLVPPTCVPGRGIYRLNLKFHYSVLTGEYEAAIPAVDGVHNWGEDGICHEDHYETEMDPDGSVSHDEFGNIKYKLLDGALIKKHLEERDRTLAYSYIRASRREPLLAGSNFSRLQRVVWDMQPFDTPSSALTRGMISGDYFQKDVIIGLNEDVVLDEDLGPEPSPAVQLDSARFINLHGHVLDAADHKLGVSGALTIMNGEVKNAEIFSLADATLTLDNAIFTSNKVEWPGTRGILLLNGSKMDSSNVVSSDNVQMDETSAAITKFDLNGDGKVDISDVTKLIDFILKK